jgi:hypothetical protein
MKHGAEANSKLGTISFQLQLSDQNRKSGKNITKCN